MRCVSRTGSGGRCLRRLTWAGRRGGHPDAFDDGEALLEATSGLGLEGVVAKKRSDPYRPGERGWVKVKHRHYWRFGQELERAQRSRSRVALV
jgi:hypothetical protein